MASHHSTAGWFLWESLSSSLSWGIRAASEEALRTEAMAQEGCIEHFHEGDSNPSATAATTGWPVVTALRRHICTAPVLGCNMPPQSSRPSLPAQGKRFFSPSSS